MPITATSRNLLPSLLLAFALVLPGGCSAPPSSTTTGVADQAAGEADATASSAGVIVPDSSLQAGQEGIPVDPSDAFPDDKPAPGMKWGDATIPAGTEIEAVLQETIDSRSARTGTIVRAVTDSPLQVGDVEVLPAGSTFDGLLGQVVPADEGHKAGGTIALRFRLVRTPVGSAAPIKAEVGAATAAAGGSAALSIVGPEPVVSGGFGGTVLAAGVEGEELILKEGTRLTIVMPEEVPIKVRL